MRVGGAGREDSVTFPRIYLLPSINSVQPSWGSLSLTLWVTACLDVRRPSPSRLCSPGLMKGLLKPACQIR